ncbi:uncharacterized protein AB9W97_016755 isoform 2-T2 [Spinachia spinachia]
MERVLRPHAAQDRSYCGLPAAQDQKGGEAVLGVGRLLPEVHPSFADLTRHFRRPTHRTEVWELFRPRRWGGNRPVVYMSRKLSEREARYSTVEKECLAIWWAVDSLCYSLLGRSFSLFSEHAPLQWLHRMKDTNTRITRWYLALQPFNFKVVHRPGMQIVVADFLWFRRRVKGAEDHWFKEGDMEYWVNPQRARQQFYRNSRSDR